MSKQLPKDLHDFHSRVNVNPTCLSNNREHEAADSYAAIGFDNSLNLSDFKDNLQIIIKDRSQDFMEFDLVGVSPAIANALRRVMISEVPTMAISKAKIYQNTSIIQDEVLAHRLGLLPIHADPRLFDFIEEGDEATEKNTTVFTLDVMCSKKDDVSMTEYHAAPSTNSINAIVRAESLKWVPQGDQRKHMKNVRIYNDKAIVAKLRDGQSIEAELWVQKGIGKTHAKYSPVSTASYRLLPDIVINKKVKGSQAKKIKKLCPLDVFDIEDSYLQATRSRQCTMCRECIRDESDAEVIKLGRVRDHFIFSVETTGAYSAKDVVEEALTVLMNKCDILTESIKENNQPLSVSS